MFSYFKDLGFVWVTKITASAVMKLAYFKEGVEIWEVF